MTYRDCQVLVLIIPIPVPVPAAADGAGAGTVAVHYLLHTRINKGAAARSKCQQDGRCQRQPDCFSQHGFPLEHKAKTETALPAQRRGNRYTTHETGNAATF